MFFGKEWVNLPTFYFEAMERIREIVKRNAEHFGLILVDFNIQKDSIEAVLYRKNGDVSVYDLERVTMLIRKDLEILNLADVYGVNLSSAGLDRVLKGREELDIFEGRNVQFTYVEESKTFTKQGVLKGNKNDDVLFETDEGFLEIPFEKLHKVSLFTKEFNKKKGGNK